MNLQLSWNQDGFKFVAVATIRASDDQSLVPLEGLLNDDGGLELAHSIAWIDTGVRRLRAAASGEVQLAEWARESWGVDCEKNRARVYFLADEEYWVDLEPQGLLRTLTLWRDFLDKGPIGGNGAINSVSYLIGQESEVLIASNLW